MYIILCWGCESFNESHILPCQKWTSRLYYGQDQVKLTHCQNSTSRLLSSHKTLLTADGTQTLCSLSVRRKAHRACQAKVIQWNSSIMATPFTELLWPLLRGGYSWGVLLVKNNLHSCNLSRIQRMTLVKGDQYWGISLYMYLTSMMRICHTAWLDNLLQLHWAEGLTQHDSCDKNFTHQDLIHLLVKTDLSQLFFQRCFG